LADFGKAVIRSNGVNMASNTIKSASISEANVIEQDYKNEIIGIRNLIDLRE
jgi:hypothetical protein